MSVTPQIITKFQSPDSESVPFKPEKLTWDALRKEHRVLVRFHLKDHLRWDEKSIVHAFRNIDGEGFRVLQ